MAAGEVVLWEADDKSMRMVPRLQRMGVTAGLLCLLGLLMWSASHATWALYAGALYLLGEIAHWAWDRRRLVEAHIVPGEADGPARLRLRRAGGRITEHDAHRVARVLVIYDNVHNLARLRLSLRGRPLLFGRPGLPPALTTWQQACPRAQVNDRSAHWGMPGVPD